MIFVIDNSVVMRWLLPEQPKEKPLREYADRVLDAIGGGHQALVPALWSTEAVSVMIKEERRRNITPGDADTFLQLLGGAGFEMHTNPEPLQEMLVLVRRHPKLSVYDATYLALALRMRCQLATNDEDLAATARAEGVDLFLGGPWAKALKRAKAKPRKLK